MLTYEDCLGFCELTEDEIDAIATHEHIPAMAAMELGQYLVGSEDGVRRIKKIILDDIEEANRRKDIDRYLLLKATLKHFVETHPEKS